MTVPDYWELTIGEMQPYIKAYSVLQEQQNQRDYQLAIMISGFVASSISGKQPPSYDKLFKVQTPTIKQDKATAFYMDQWKDFAEKRNKQLKEQNK